MALKKILLLFVFLICDQLLLAQSYTQTVRGTIVDKVSRSPLPGATIVVVGSDPLIGSATDADGNFKLANVPIGSHAIKISFVGYKEQLIPNLIVNSGKEVVLSIPIEEDIVKMEAIVVTADKNIDKNKPMNDMTVVSGRTFSVEETRKFAAAINDPARMVASYAGVVQTSDGNNSISIRGNSPFGLLWRMEGVDIPNPNHFANVAASGGGISIISSQLLGNSDFITGAFAAEYGNALAGVFDLNLRKGNNEKREYTIQAGFLGTDVAAEGPFSGKYRGSYLVNYRYSTLALLSQFGANVGDAATNFQDLSFNFYLPTNRMGNFSVFGFGGLSDQAEKAKADSSQWTEDSRRFTSTYFSNTGAAGIKHSLTINSKTYLQSAVLFSGNDHGELEHRLDNNYVPQFDHKSSFINKKITVSSVLNYKINAKHALRSGMYLNRYFFNLEFQEFNKETNIVDYPLGSSGTANTVQLFSQWNYRLTQNLTVNTGLHYLQLMNNNNFSFEPRFSMKYDLNQKESISFGFGEHSQMQPIGIYVAQTEQADGSFIQPNKNIGFNRARHFVFAYDRSLSQHLRVKTEVYYQHLYNIAVKNDPASPLSTLSNEDGYITDPLVNKGFGRNYGLELTLEHFMHNNLYFLLSSSFYNSEYKALDGVWRNTRFNGKAAFSFTAGKEFAWKNNRTAGVNLRTIYSGGLRTTPIDIVKSIEVGETKRIESLAYTEHLPDYFRTDLRFSIKRNRVKTTTTWALDIQNMTNHENLGGQYFDARSGKIKEWYQLGLLPVLSYRVEF